VKTSEELVALQELTEEFPKPAFDGTDRDEVLQGFLQAIYDFSNENKPIDVFRLVQVAGWNPKYAIGYKAGRSAAYKVWIAMQPKQPPKINKGEHHPMGVYGRLKR
jgi:hypothetical protein